MINGPRIALSTIPIYSVDRSGNIESVFNGVLLLHKGFYFVLSVAHGLKNRKSRPAIVLHNDPMFANVPNWMFFNPTKLKQYKLKFFHPVVKFLSKTVLRANEKLRSSLAKKVIRYVGPVDFMSSVVPLTYVPKHNLPLNSQLFGCDKII